MNMWLLSVLILNVLAFGIRFVSYETTCAVFHIPLVAESDADVDRMPCDTSNLEERELLSHA